MRTSAFLSCTSTLRTTSRWPEGKRGVEVQTEPHASPSSGLIAISTEEATSPSVRLVTLLRGDCTLSWAIGGGGGLLGNMAAGVRHGRPRHLKWLE